MDPPKLCHPPKAGLTQKGVLRDAGSPPATSVVSWADKGQSCPAKVSGGTLKKDLAKASTGRVLPCQFPCEHRTNTKLV